MQDNLGNRTQMTDGMGTVAYAYDSLSRMTSETRDFTDTLADAPTGGVFTISYQYALSGMLKSYTDPYGDEIDYTHQKTGRLSTVTGSTFGGVTTYATNPTYRAWGALKHLEYGSGGQMQVGYNDRLKAESYLVNSIAYPTNETFDKAYTYYADGSLKLIDESSTTADDKFDRAFTYDHQGRIRSAKTGTEAHGTTETDLTKLPYRQSYAFDAFGNITNRNSTLWNYDMDPPYGWGFVYTITNNRNSNAHYNHDGRLTEDRDETDFDYDASGQMIRTYREWGFESTFGKDGDGAELKRSNRTYSSQSGVWSPWTTGYFIRSSVLGQIVTEVGETGKKKSTYVLASGSIIARQYVNNEDTEGVGWRYRDPSGMSTRYDVDEELDPLGNNVGIAPNTSSSAQHGSSESPTDRITFGEDTGGDCELDGILTPCSMVDRAMQIGAVQFQARYHTAQHGFRYETYDIDTSLPGRQPLPIAIPIREYNSITIDGQTTTYEGEIIGYIWGDFRVCGGPGEPPCPKEGIGKAKPEKGTDGIDCDDQKLIPVAVIDGSSDPANRNKKNIPYINPAMQEPFQAALDEINENIGPIGFTEMFRDYARQEYLYNEYKAGRIKIAARAGTSKHEAGFAFDISNEYRLKKAANGDTVEDGFKRHGFLKTVAGDLPHFAWEGRAKGAAAVRLNAEFNAWFLKCTPGY